MAGLVLGGAGEPGASGRRVSGLLLERDWLGLAGWQWVFLVEGRRRSCSGVAVPFLLTDRPRHARWLTPAERDWLEKTLAAERRATAGGPGTLGPGPAAARRCGCWRLGILATNTGGYAAGLLAADGRQGAARRDGRPPADRRAELDRGAFTCSGLAGVWVSGRSSDRTGDRKWHCVAGQVLAGAVPRR